MEIKDSGERRKFDTGATRDIADGKGRCDLLPLDILGLYQEDIILFNIGDWVYSGDHYSLWKVIKEFSEERFGDIFTAMLEVSKHYEAGANKYAPRNWEKGIPLHCYIDSGKRFQFKQGLDERLLTVDKIKELSRWKYDGEVIFAFDNIDDKDLIISKLRLIRETVPDWTRELKFYVFCGYDRKDIWDEKFWEKDISDIFERITILRQFNAKPYIMRHERVYESRYSSFYAVVAAYCNQPAMFKSFSFRMFAQCRGMRREGYKKYKRDIEGYLAEYGFKGSEWRNMELIESLFPQIANKYYDLL